MFGELDVRQVLLIVVREERGAVHIDRDEVQPVTGLRMFGRGQGLRGGCNGRLASSQPVIHRQGGGDFKPDERARDSLL